jgi:hypothetical protein
MHKDYPDNAVYEDCKEFNLSDRNLIKLRKLAGDKLMKGGFKNDL